MHYQTILPSTSLSQEMYKKDNVLKFNPTASPKTYCFQRHAFTCNNLSKEVGIYSKFTKQDEDPSLSLYGILSMVLLNRSNPMLPHFEGRVFVSPLIRTWQSAILEYPRDDLELIVSPYIIEKQNLYNIGNRRLSIEIQLEKMKQFMDYLRTIQSVIKSPYLNLVLNRKIVVQDNKNKYKIQNNNFVFSHDYIEEVKDNIIEQQSRGIEVFHDTFATSYPDIVYKDPHPNKYYGGDSFQLFDHWIRKNWNIETYIFVVCHSKTMQSILEQIAPQSNLSKYSNQNSWKFIVTTPSGNVTVYSGQDKPKFRINLDKEELCYKPLPKAGSKNRVKKSKRMTFTRKYRR